MSNPNASLYDRLGGVYAIAAVVDIFIDRIMVCPILNANPLVDEAHHRVPKAGFKYLVTEMVCMATGGPQRYTGKAMTESHRHLENHRVRVERVRRPLQGGAGSVQGARGRQKELFDIVGTTRGDIVMVEDTTPAERKAG